MCLTTIRDVSKSALIRRVAEYLRENSITNVPEWLKMAATDVAPDELTAWWYGEAAASIVQYYRLPMLKPKSTRTARGQALASMITQFEQLGWIRIDRTGIMLVSKQGEARLMQIAGQSRCSGTAHRSHQ
jgi:ribosomal protein S19E (S16A)